MVLERIVSSLVKTGDLTITDWNGQIRRYGGRRRDRLEAVLEIAGAVVKLP